MLHFLLPGSEELARAVRKILPGTSTRAVLPQNHGLVTVGKDFEEALNIAEEIDEAAKVFVPAACRACPIPANELARIG